MIVQGVDGGLFLGVLGAFPWVGLNISDSGDKRMSSMVIKQGQVTLVPLSEILQQYGQHNQCHSGDWGNLLYVFR